MRRNDLAYCDLPVAERTSGSAPWDYDGVTSKPTAQASLDPSGLDEISHKLCVGKRPEIGNESGYEIAIRNGETKSEVPVEIRHCTRLACYRQRSGINQFVRMLARRKVLKVIPFRGYAEDWEVVRDKVRGMSANQGVEIIQVSCSRNLMFQAGSGAQTQQSYSLMVKGAGIQESEQAPKPYCRQFT
jgi:hypothetical protein